MSFEARPAVHVPAVALKIRVTEIGEVEIGLQTSLEDFSHLRLLTLIRLDF